MAAPPVQAEAQDVCASDPNFAAIFAFCERFGDSCGVTVPTFQELQEMLEKTDEVPDALVDLHIKLLRRVKKSVHVDKWERGILKFCQGYSIPEFWELEHYGYKGISVKLKLRILKTLLEAQFDSNVKFKAEINKLESSTLRSQPLGWDKSGRAYWVQFDRACNIRVYKEDGDEDTWTIVAKDRSSLVNLINELSGIKDKILDNIEDSNNIGTSSDTELELSSDLNNEINLSKSPNTIPLIDNIKETSINQSKIELNDNVCSSNENSCDEPINLKKIMDEKVNSHNKTNVLIVGETIEEPVMLVEGEGSGQECDTGNPDEPNTQNETTKNDDTKKPKLWSIETMCSSSQEVKEEIISVPTTGFFFGDDSVPCFNNVSNGENSHIRKEKIEVDSKENDEEFKKIINSDKVDSNINANITKSLKEECSTSNQEESSPKKKLTQSVFNIKIHEEEVQITERKANEVFTTPESNTKSDTYKESTSVIDTLMASHVPQSNNKTNILEVNEGNCSSYNDEINKHDTKDIVNQNIIYEKVTTNNISTEVKDYPSNHQSISIDRDKQESKEDSTEQLKIDQQLITKKNDEKSIIIDEYNNDNSIQINKESTEIIQNDQVENKTISSERAKVSELCTNTVDSLTEQKNDSLKQNISEKDTINLSNVVNPQEIVTNIDTIFENKEEIGNPIVEDNKLGKQISEDVGECIQTTNNLGTNTIYSNKDQHQHVNIEQGQTVMKDVDHCHIIPKQKEDDQNVKTTKKTYHIRNIIERDLCVSSDCIQSNENQLSCTTNANKQLDNYKIKNDNNDSNNVDLDTSQIVYDSKHSLDKILQKSNTIEEITENLDSVKAITHKEQILMDTHTSSIYSNESEINIKNVKTKSIDSPTDLSFVKEDCKQLEENKNIDLNHSEPEEEIIEVIDKTPKSHYDKTSKMSIKLSIQDKKKQKNLKMSDMEIKLDKNKKKECNLINNENKTDISYKEELKNVSCNKQIVVHHVDIPDNTSTNETHMDIDQEITVDISKNDKLTKNDEIAESGTDTQTHTFLIEEQNKHITQEENIEKKNMLYMAKEQFITSSICEDLVESDDDEIKENTSMGILKEEFDKHDLGDQIIQEDIKSEEEVEDMPKKKGRPGRKKGKRGRAKKINTDKPENKINSEEKVKRKYKPRQKKVTIAEEVTIFPETVIDDNVRRSRRIAEIKIKEQFIPNAQYDDMDIPLKVSKKKDKIGKKGFTPTKKMVNADESDEDEEDPVSKKFKGRKRKGKPDSLKKLNMVNPWNVDSESSSSENNVELFEDYDHEEEDEIPRPGIEPNVSDHEFSPESDINEEDEDYLPEKRARTAHKKNQGEQFEDDMSCKKCNKSDQPEWILLCDTCNQGWHASCLRPALMVIPDGDWYCPPCRHESLLNALKDILKRYDGESKKRENEELRRKRLAYVGISLQNVISSKTEDIKVEKQQVVHESSEQDDEEESESESYDSEPLYQLRARRQANVSYRFNDYDDMINEAILEETGVDESLVRKPIDIKTDKNDNDEKTDSDNDENDRENSPIAPALLHLRGRRKSKKLTNLDISSDDGSDEDFKGPSDDNDEYDEDVSEYSDDSFKKRQQPTRRSGRNRKTVVDPDFINDDSSEDSDNRNKKKRSRPQSDTSNSEEEDFTWGKKKKKRTNTPSTSFLPYKKSKGIKRKNMENLKPKKSKIKYGMDSDSDDQPQRRTRGRQITYAESDDSEEEIKPKKRKLMRDEEDDYVLNDEELEAENEDRNLEIDDEDTIASNEEKDEDEVDEEEVDDEEVGDEEEEEEEEDSKDDTSSKLKNETTVIQPSVVKLPPAVTAVPQSVIQKPITTTPLAALEECRPILHQRLLPVEDDKQTLPQLSVDPVVVGTPDKHKRLPHQPKKCPSPNPPVDYAGGGCYPCPPDATKVVSAIPPPPIQPVVYNKQSASVLTSTGGFKSITTTIPQPPSSFHPTPYRMANKIAPETVSAAVPTLPVYHPPQVQQVYQAPLRTNYSPFPIDYATAGVPLPPPSTAVPIRNVIAPTSSQETLPMTTLHQNLITTVGGDSEFGGLVSYFSSQQEDDFDT